MGGEAEALVSVWCCLLGVLLELMKAPSSCQRDGVVMKQKVGVVLGCETGSCSDNIKQLRQEKKARLFLFLTMSQMPKDDPMV